MLKKVFFILSFVLLMVLVPLTSFAAITATPSDGWIIYDPDPGYGYRYGPSSIINADNSIDMYFSSPGLPGSGTMDCIRHKRSTDGGHTWSAETVVLQPTPNSDDRCSCCDPSILKFGGYYYLAYTSTKNADETLNSCFVARSVNATGPFEKWNGSGWGGNPKAFILFNGNSKAWGAGEPIMTKLNNTLHIYCGWADRASDGTPFSEQRHWTADATNPNWPASLSYIGPLNRAVNDIKYIDAYGKFFAISQGPRGFRDGNYMQALESTDGHYFSLGNLPRGFIATKAHNVGLSGDAEGHINLQNQNYIAYAYGSGWGTWHTNMHPITFTNDNLPGKPDVNAIALNGQVKLSFDVFIGNNITIKYGTSSGNYTNTITNVTSSPYTVPGLTNGTKYYFVVEANNSNGSSGNSVEVNSMPLDYTIAPRVSATASSYLTGWEPSLAIDGNNLSCWSSHQHTTAANPEWIYVDTGAGRSIKRVSITPRLPTYYGWAEPRIQLSVDGTEWHDAICNETFSTDGSNKVYELKEATYARYVRLYFDNLGKDEFPNSYYAQLGDIKIEYISDSASSSSALTGWESFRAIDNYPISCWSSVSHSTDAATEWIYVSTGYSRNVTGVRLTPRTNGSCFPVDFKFQYSNDGSTWTDIAGQSYTNYIVSDSNVKLFKFGSPVTAKYIRLYATRLKFDGTSYYCQLFSFQVDTDIKLSATASSQLAGWEASRAVDSWDASLWSSNYHSTPDAVEWISVDAGSIININKVTLTPRYGCSFPENFDIEYSTDNVNWSLVPNQSYTAYCDAAKGVPTFTFNAPVQARYIRIKATKLTLDDVGNFYYFQLGEIRVE